MPPTPGKVYKWGNRYVNMSTNPDSNTYDHDEAEFLRAIDEYKRRSKKKFLTWIEVLDIARSLGWRKEAKVDSSERQAGSG